MVMMDGWWMALALLGFVAGTRTGLVLGRPSAGGSIAMQHNNNEVILVVPIVHQIITTIAALFIDSCYEHVDKSLNYTECFIPVHPYIEDYRKYMPYALIIQ